MVEPKLPHWCLVYQVTHQYSVQPSRATIPYLLPYRSTEYPVRDFNLT